jgi:tRNA threonylcarbamoyl adenosine modification protein YeaZ
VGEWGLAVSTSGAWLGLAVGRAHDDMRSAQWLENRQMSENLLPRIAEFLPPVTFADLAWVAVIVGPGSFTSLRLGVVFARTLGQQLNIPVFTQSALVCGLGVGKTYAAISMAAHGGKVYGTVFKDGEQILPEQLFTQEAWLVARGDLPHIVLDELPTTVIVECLFYKAWQDYDLGLRPLWQEAQPLYLQPFPALL